MPTKPLSKPIIDKPSMKDLVKPYSDEEIKNRKDKRDKNLKKLYKKYDIELEEPKTEHLSFIPEKKKAYPNYDQYQYMPAAHDMNKWLKAVKEIHYKQKAGLPYKEAVRLTVGDWKKMEVFDFLNWLRFHEEGSHMKYKFAQVWYENGQPGYFLHVKPDPPAMPEPVSDGASVDRAAADAERQEEKRNTIEKQRQKIIGRLDSAEKLLRSPEGQQFAGDELEQLMEAIYTLKKKVQLVNKLSVSTRLYEDMIVREGNVLKRAGLHKGAQLLYSLAQSAEQSAESATGKMHGGLVPMHGQEPMDPSGAGFSGMPNEYVNLSVNDPTQPANVNQDQPSLDALSADAPPPPAPPPAGGDTPPPAGGPPAAQPTAESTPAIMPQGTPQPAGIKNFISNMNEGAMTDVTVADDMLEVEDESLAVAEYELPSLVSRAQAAPPGPPGPPPAALEDVPMTDEPAPERNPPTFIPPKADKPATKPGEEEPLEVTEDDIKPEDATPTTGFSNKIDTLMASVTIADIVAELEDISKDYKTRSQPRRLSKVDMMLDSVGLASMFPSLSEAQNKALEANNYISTRVDDILAKLRGAMASAEKPAGVAPERPDVAGIKGKLQSDQDKEAKRKQMRKEQEAAELEAPAKETPNVEMGELAPPAAPPAAPAAGPPAARPLG